MNGYIDVNVHVIYFNTVNGNKNVNIHTIVMFKSSTHVQLFT